MLKNLLLIHLFFFSFVVSSFSQRTCGTMQYLEQQMAHDPELENRMQQIELETQQYIQKNKDKTGERAIITIPVVFHVVYKTTAQNIPDQRLIDQIKVLNEDFRKLNANNSNVPSVWQNIAADAEIEFCLAQRDPNGNATNGITRTSTTVTSFGQDDKVKFTSQGGKDIWDRSKYLNIWVCNLQPLLGYATFPGSTSNVDGVVCNYRYVGLTGAIAPYDLGRTATHEVGHWLNLRHIWGNGTCGNDNVSDTPTQEKENYGCPSFPHVSCSNGPNGDMFMNYMDYSDDACMCMFTEGQKTRMQAALNGTRASLKTSNGCVPLNVAAGVNIAITSGSNPACEGTSLTFTATPVNGGTSPSYQWKVGSTNVGTNSPTYTTNTLTNGQTVTCVVTSNMPGVTGNPATSNAITMTINATPSPSVSGTTTICNGDHTTLIASGGGTYSWNTGETTSSIIVSPANTTTYSVSVTKSGCTGTANEVVTVNENPSPGISGTTSICSGNNTILTASGGETYSWNTGETTSSIIVSPANTTTYSVSVTKSGCTGTANAIVIVNANPSPGISGTTSICSGNNTTLTASGGETYSWNTGETTSSIIVSPANTTTYSVSVTKSGCTGTANEVVTVKPTPATPTISQNGSELISSAPAGNQWYLNGNLIPGATNQNYTITGNGNYTIIVTINGCSSSASAPFNVINTGIALVNSEYNLKVYPNPNNGIFYFSFNVTDKSSCRIEIKNMIGQALYTEEVKNYNGLYKKQVDLTEYGKGLYFISLISSDTEVVRKVIIY